MIKSEHLPEWYIFTIPYANLNEVLEWLESQTDKSRYQCIRISIKTVNLWFKDENLVALFKLKYNHIIGDYNIP